MTHIVMRNEISVEMSDEEFAAEFGAYVEPPEPPPVVPEEISDRQFYQELAIEGLITRDEARAAVKTGTLPEIIQAGVDGMEDPDQQFAADMMLSGATIFLRHHPMVTVLGLLLGKDDAQLDQIWIDGAKL